MTTTHDVRLVAVCAGVSSPSSTRTLTDQLVVAAARRLRAEGRRVTVEVVEIRDLARDALEVMLGGPRSPRLRAFEALLADADAVIVAAPIFRGSYPGTLKIVLDVVDADALAGTPVALAATGGTLRHALAIDHELRPLFAFLKAMTVPTGVFATSGDCTAERIPEHDLHERIERAAAELAGLAVSAPVTAPVSAPVSAPVTGSAADVRAPAA